VNVCGPADCPPRTVNGATAGPISRPCALPTHPDDAPIDIAITLRSIVPTFMSVAVVYSRAQVGIEAPLVTIEVHLSNGLPGLSIVGLPEAAVKESKDRVRSALLNSQFEFPLRRITINLAPADLPKEGGRFDLAIALGVLAASGQLDPAACLGLEFVGELALTGELRPVRGILPSALSVRNAGRALVVPRDNAAEAALVDALRVFPAEHLLQVCAHVQGQTLMQPCAPAPVAPIDGQHVELADIKSQYHAKRALEIAAGGGHNLLILCPLLRYLAHE
jgi:magnesium chelatase family protein